MSAVLSRWGTWKQYVAWYEGKEKPDPTWDDKVIACNDRDDFLQLFSAEGIPGTKWRNSYWLNSGSKLPSSKGGVGRCFRNLQKALARRFGKFTLFLEYMDGIPEGGITSDEQADKLVCSEAQRLGTTPDKLLGYTGTTGIDFWRKSPALVRVLEHFSPDLSTEGRAKTIDAETIAGSLEQEYRTLERGQQDGDIDPDLLADYYSDVRRVARETVYARTQVSSPQELSELFVEIRKAVAAIPKQGLPKRVTQRVDRCRNRARNDLASNAGWQEAPLRTNNKLTDRGLSALNTARDRQGLGKIITSDVQFLRETLTEEEERGLEALVAELGEAARAEYLCAKFQDRFQYNHRTVENLRKWLGKVETYGGNPLEDVPIGLFTIKELSQLRHAFFNRMRDKYQKFYRQGIETVTRELEGSMDRASHPLQKDFIQELITYFAETEAIAHPSRLKTSIGEGEEFPAKHQKIAVKEIEKQRSMLVADEMGGGKTGSTIAAFEHLREQGKAHKALIMCPAQIVPVWKKALSGNNGSCFVDGRAPRTAFIESGNKNWEAAQDAEYIVMSIEMSRGGTRIGDPSLAIEHPDNRLAKKLGIQPGDTVSHEDLIKSLGADFFALDEAHNVKNPRGEDTERIFRISQSESVLNGHLMLLSGTPIPNTIRDIAAQLRLLYAGREEVDGIDITNLQSITKAILRGHPLLVRNLLVRRMLRRKTQECLPVENEYHREVVENKLSPLEQAQYDSILNCPFYEATEKIRLLRRLCLMSESKYKQVCSAVETALFRPKYEHEKAPKIVIAESWFARGVTRDQAHRHDVDDSEVDTYTAGRIRAEYDGIAKVFILDGTNSSRKDQILSEFEASEEPAILITLTAVAGEGLDISCASDGILITPTDTVAKEEQFARRMNRIGQEKDVHLQVLQIEDSIEQGIAEYAVRKAELVEEFLNGRPLTAEELCILEDDTTRINRGGFLAYEVMSPHEKILWIFSRIYGKGKEAVREFFELDDGKYAVDLARFYPLEEETSYQGNTARLIAGIISKYLSDGNAQIADIACGCRTMERMFRDNTNVSVASSDINGAMLSVGSEILGGDGSINEDEVCTMDELPYGEQSKDVAVLSLALHYTRHNPRKTGSASGKERVKALCEMNRVLKDGGIGIITLPVNTFEDEESFRNFCAVFERCLGFEVVAESSNLAHSIDNESEEPFDVWVLTVRKTGEPRAKEMTDGDWRALCLTKLKTATSSSIARTFGEDNEHETHGSYHEKFSIGGESVTFIPITDEQASFRDERNVEKERYGRIRNRISDLLREYGSMKDIPEEILLSISLEEVASADQHDRDEYFQMLLEHYGSVGRVPTKEISEESPVILIRGESKKGSYLCLGRIDGTRKKPCGYGRRYFYEQMA